jgi:hypothetical protein
VREGWRDGNLWPIEFAMEVRMSRSAIRNVVVLLLTMMIGSAVMAAQTAPAQKTGTEFYAEYQAALAKAKKIDDLLPFMGPAQRKMVDATPVAERPKTFEMMKMMSVTNVKITKEERTSTGATLTAEGLSPMDKTKMTGKITLVREGGAWKIGEESWKN